MTFYMWLIYKSWYVKNRIQVPTKFINFVSDKKEKKKKSGLQAPCFIGVELTTVAIISLEALNYLLCFWLHNFLVSQSSKRFSIPSSLCPLL